MRTIRSIVLLTLITVFWYCVNCTQCPGMVVDLHKKQQLSPLVNCSLISGVLLIRNVDDDCCRSKKCGLSNLVEIIGTLIIEYGNCSSDLSNFFPRLKVLRNFVHTSYVDNVHYFEEYVLIVRHTKLRRIGLTKLTMLTSGRVALIDNPLLCYVDIVRWNDLYNTSYNHWPGNKNVYFNLGTFCPDVCPSGHSGSMNAGCWFNSAFQYACTSMCKKEGLSCNSLDGESCCHWQCSGGCYGKSASDCVSCKYVKLNGTCLEECPSLHYLLNGYHCLSRRECINRVENRGDRSHRTLNYSIYGNRCVRKCPNGYRRSSTGDCILCPDFKCSKHACGHLRIYKISDLDQVKGCSVAQSLLINLANCGGMRSSHFMSAFIHLKEIIVGLYILNSDSLTSLEFLQQLRVIHGLNREDTTNNALEVTGNRQLTKLWTSGHQKLLIKSGRVLFNSNQNLCPEHILHFVQSNIDLSRVLTNLEFHLITKSNGAVGLCHATHMDLSVTSVSQRSINLDVVTPVWSDPRQVLPINIYYKHINVLETTHNEVTVCGDDWEIDEPLCGYNEIPSHSPFVHPINNTWKFACSLNRLKPAKMYRAFLEMRIMYNGQGALSDVFTFQTKPAKPNPPKDFHAITLSPYRIQLHWNAPEISNGHVTEYRIWYKKLTIDPTRYQFTCSDTLPNNDIVPALRMDIVTHLDGDGKSSCCSCSSCINLYSKGEKNLSPINSLTDSPRSIIANDSNWSERQELIQFEDSLQNLLLHPNIDNVPSTRAKRSILWTDVESDWQNYITYPVDKSTSNTPTTTNHTSSVSYIPTFNLLITELHHFTNYLFAISACHSPHDEAGNPLMPKFKIDGKDEPWCSTKVFFSQRTGAVILADNIDPQSIQVITQRIGIDDEEEFNISSNFIHYGNASRLINIRPETNIFKKPLTVSRLRWVPPSKPNGLTLHYWIRYRRVETQFNKQASVNAEWSVICVSRQDFQSDTTLDETNFTIHPFPIFTHLYDLPPGCYELQLMSVSLAGNGSWTAVKLIEVVDFTADNRVMSGWKIFKDYHSIWIVIVVLKALLIATVIFYMRRRISRTNTPKNHRPSVRADLLQKWEICSNDIHWDSDRILGRGSFSIVCLGKLMQLTTPAVEQLSANVMRNLHHPSRLDIAVKILLPATTADNIQEILNEALLMSTISCYHIVQFFGLLIQHTCNKLPVLVMEYMAHGDLATYLRQRMSNDDYPVGSIPSQLAVNWAAELADGMNYLTNLDIVHRDLAARNCLVDINLTVKIGDFGLARHVNDHTLNEVIVRDREPIRWMSPESLNSRCFTTKSDVWAYGIVLWEIATFASVPYPGLSNDEVIKFVTTGGRLSLSPNHSNKLPHYLLAIMDRCWQFEPCRRPCFQDILISLEPFVNTVFRSNSSFHCTPSSEYLHMNICTVTK